MQRTLLVGMAFLGLTGLAGAADLPVKAPAPYTSYLDTSGCYWGIEAGAGVQQASTSGSSLFATSLVSGNLNASGGQVGGAVGCMRGSSAQWMGFQASVDYQNISAGSGVVGIASRWSGQIEARWGGATNPLTVLQQAFSTIGIGGVTFPTFSPVPPSGVTVDATAARTYVAGGVDIRGISGSVGSVDGANVQFAPMLKIGTLWPVLNAAGKQTGNAVDVSAYVAWPIRGFQLDGFGATTGGPQFAGGVSTGTEYGAKIAYLFPVPR